MVTPMTTGTIHWSWASFFGLVYGVLSIGVVIFCLKATLTDSTDRSVKATRWARAQGKELLDDEDLEYYCDVCQAYVGDRSKHCGDCNRCVELFDHHCKWMNNCVGAKNYREFLILISLVFSQSLVYMFNLLIGMLLILPFIRGDQFKDTFEQWYGVAWWWLAWLLVIPSIVLNSLIIVFTGLLIKLHIKLIKTDFTAYEYLVYKQEKKTLKKELKEGDINETVYKKKIEKLLDRENRKKRSKIIHQIKSEERAKRRQEKIAFGGGKVISREEIKEQNLYYWCSSGLCSNTIKKKKKG